MPHLLEVRNLTTRFDVEDGVVHAVNSISYMLNEGESMAIVGESGSGKSVSAPLELVRVNLCRKLRIPETCPTRQKAACVVLISHTSYRP